MNTMIRAGLASLALLFVAHTAAAQSGNPIARAQSLMQQERYEDAAMTLRTVTAEDPDNARAWLLLGMALHAAGEYDEALEAHRRAAQFEETAPQAIYNRAGTLAQKGDIDGAFETLERARAGGRVNLTGMDLDPDMEPLRDDPRYPALFPSSEAYADPFVEDTRVIHDWQGEAVGDQFGWIARNIGDVDGDGVNDMTTSAPTNDDGGENAGKVYAYSGRTGALLWARTGETEGAQLGIGVEAAGDVDADGVPDVAAGAPGAGVAYVFSGRDGSTLHRFEADDPEADQLGQAVTDVGDVDGDGHADVLVGAPGARGTGRAYLYSGRDGSRLSTFAGEDEGDRFGAALAGSVVDGWPWIVVGAGNAGPEDRGRTYVYHGLTTTPAFTIDADETGANLGGMFVSVVGDVDADGTPDVYASDWSNNAKGRSTGRVYVHSGATGERLMTLTGEDTPDGFGIGPADAGDVDGDGYDDLIIGAWQHASEAPSGGKVYLFSGRDGSLMRTWTSAVPGETFGFDATGMGDVDGDGTTDFLLTSAWSGINGSRSGRVLLLSGG